MVYKFGYVLARQSALFSLPGLRKVRNWFYSGHLGTVDLNVDDFVRIGPAHRTEQASVKIGRGIRVGRNAEIDCSGGVVIGDRVTISEDAKIYTHDHVIDDGYVNWRRNGLRMSHLTIADDVWVGAGAMVLSTVTYIGRGAVIGCGSVLRADVPDLAVVAGNPARIVRERRCVDAVDRQQGAVEASVK